MPTTTELTENYLREHPSIKDCLKKGIINYSKLARKIGKELGIEKKTSMEAILIACRRFAVKIKKEEVLEEKILTILQQSTLEIKNKVVVVIIQKRVPLEIMERVEKKVRKTEGLWYLIEGTKVFTLIISEQDLEVVKNNLKKEIIKTSMGLALITLKSPEELETTPGVMLYLYSLLGDQGINVVETMSCWTDTIFIVEEKEVSKIIGLFRFSALSK